MTRPIRPENLVYGTCFHVYQTKKHRHCINCKAREDFLAKFVRVEEPAMTTWEVTEMFRCLWFHRMPMNDVYKLGREEDKKYV